MLANLKQRLQSLRELQSLAVFLKQPDKLDNVLRLTDSLKNSALSAKMFQHVLTQPAMAALVAEQWRPAPIDLEALEQLPQGCLGHTYGHHLRSLGLTHNNLIDPNPITSPQDFVTHRVHETHDILHVLTGFGTDDVGELGMQAFYLAQNRSLVSVLLIFEGMLSALQNDKPLEPVLSALARGFELGLKAECVIAQKLEEGWERPLADWQRQLRLL